MPYADSTPLIASVFAFFSSCAIPGVETWVSLYVSNKSQTISNTTYDILGLHCYGCWRNGVQCVDDRTGSESNLAVKLMAICKHNKLKLKSWISAFQMKKYIPYLDPFRNGKAEKTVPRPSISRKRKAQEPETTK